jgi:hypothetical protein
MKTLRGSNCRLLLFAALPLAAVARPSALARHVFEVRAAAEVVATLQASCRPCSWEVAGREAAVLALFVDGRYSQHLPLVRGEEAADYRVSLGALPAGQHALEVRLDRGATPAAVTEVGVLSVDTLLVGAADPEHAALSHAPILYARAGALSRFSDVPLVMWHETEKTPRGRRIRYSVVFSHEDGGTPADRLMATWGRLSDIEFVYDVELDDSGRILSQTYQGRDHRILPFGGRREGRHPLLWVATENNMLADRGAAQERLALVPVAFDLAGVSREAVMDAFPWTYRISAQEVRREGRVAPDALPGSEKVKDPRRFVHVEACAETQDAALAFGIGLDDDSGQLSFFDSDAGLPKFRISRSPDHFPNGCFRGAVALPDGVSAARIRALRFRAFTRLPARGEAPLPPGSGRARLLRVNRVFMLDADDLPGASLFAWKGDIRLAPEGAAIELAVRSPAARATAGGTKGPER